MAWLRYWIGQQKVWKYCLLCTSLHFKWIINYKISLHYFKNLKFRHFFTVQLYMARKLHSIFIVNYIYTFREDFLSQMKPSIKQTLQSILTYHLPSPIWNWSVINVDISMIIVNCCIGLCSLMVSCLDSNQAWIPIPSWSICYQWQSMRVSLSLYWIKTVA